MKAIAIIPARGGSKRIPRKNVKLFLGFPIIKYAIEAAVSSGCFDEIMVSTDDKEIASFATKFGASVPFFRSAGNASDTATTAAVVEEVLEEYKKLGKQFDVACCIYPTAVFVNGKKLAEAVKLLESKGVDAVISVVRFGSPVQRALKIENEKLKMFWPENMQLRTQDLETAYYDAGQFYCLDTRSFLEQKKLFARNTLPIIVPESEAQDIDNEEDWKIAEIKYQLLNK